jgi:nucleotide-binding universal stress UspA family protein
MAVTASRRVGGIKKTWRKHKMNTTKAANRIQLKNILYATDFSRAADAAFPYAAEFARRFGAKFYAVHARTPENYLLAAPEAWSSTNAEYEKQENALREVLRSDLPHIATEVLAAVGDVWLVLKSVIDEKKIDLLVLGTKGRTGIGKFFLGSVAEEIVRQAHCPVLTVGPHSPSEPPREGRFRQILYATDFSEESLAAAPYAISLTQEHQAHLTVLHVIDKSGAPDFVRPDEVEASAVRQMQNLVPGKAALWCEPRYAVREGRPSEAILEVAKKEKSDLIVLGVRKPEGIPGGATHLPTAVAHKVIAQAVCPVLTVRA